MIGYHMNKLMLRSIRNLTKRKGRLTGDVMEKQTKHYVESLNHDPNWLNTINIEIDKFLIDCEYIEFFMKMYMQWIKDDGSTSSSRTLIIPPLPRFEILALSKFQLYIETETMTPCFVCCNFPRRLFSFDLLKSEKIFFVFCSC